MMHKWRGSAFRSLSLILKFHWAAILAAPLLLSLSDQPIGLATWTTFGLFLLYTAGLQFVAGRYSSSVPWPALGYAALTVDLLFVTMLVAFRGGLQSDAYQIYYLVIVGFATVFGLTESMIAAVAAGLLYWAAVVVGGEDPADPGRVAIRVIYLAFTGVAAAYLTGRERRQRLAWVEAERLLNELREAHAELAAHARHMSQRAVTDGLTQLYNHAYLHQRLDEELSRAERYGRHLSLLMLDLDDFKAHNDTYGHVEGDRLLAEIATVLSEAIRKGDAACRYGGEEFAVIMPEADREAALVAAERICSLVGSTTPMGEVAPRPVTVSIGVATYPDDGVTKMDLIAAADRALYRSKAAGKNQVS